MFVTVSMNFFLSEIIIMTYYINTKKGHQLVQLKFEEQITTITATKDGESLLVATINGLHLLIYHLIRAAKPFFDTINL
jgi:hypothetical protein